MTDFDWGDSPPDVKGPAAGAASDNGPASATNQEASAASMVSEAPPKDALLDPAPWPFLRGANNDEFWSTKPFLAHIRAFSEASGAHPLAVLGLCLVRASMLIPPHVVLDGIVGQAGSLNLQVCLVAESGQGKGVAEATARAAFSGGRWAFIREHTGGSGEGLVRQFAYVKTNNGVTEQHWVDEANKAVLFSFSEGDMLAALNTRSGNTLPSALKMAFSGEKLGNAYADPTKAVILPAHEYRLGLSVAIQPGKAEPLFEDAVGGFPQRLLWLPAAGWPGGGWDRRERPEPMKYPEQTYQGSRIVIHFPQPVRDYIWFKHRAKSLGYERLDELDSHSMFIRMKVAALLAALDGHRDVDLTDWALSGYVMYRSRQQRDRVLTHISSMRAEANVAAGIAQGQKEAASQEVLEKQQTRRAKDAMLTKLRQVGAEGITASDLKKTTRHPHPAYAELVDAGKVIEDPVPGKGVRCSLAEYAEAAS